MKLFQVSRIKTLALVLLVLPWTAASAAQPSTSTVVLQGGRISVTAHGAPLMDVLAEVSRQGGFPIRLDAGLQGQVARARTDAVFDSVTPEHELRRLLQTESLVFVYTGNGLAEVRGYADRARRAPRGVEAHPRIEGQAARLCRGFSADARRCGGAARSGPARGRGPHRRRS